MTEAQQRETTAGDNAARGNDLITVSVHRGLHAAALILTHHHIASYEAYANQPELNHGELHEVLIEVTGAGVKMDTALDVARELASHFLPAFISGRDERITVVVSDSEATHEEVEALRETLRNLKGF
jgi:hypothetical protein